MEWDLIDFSFPETRYINRYIDYAHWKESKHKVQKLFRESSNPLSVISATANDGFLEVMENQNYLVDIFVEDFVGNTTHIKIPVTGKQRISVKPETIKLDRKSVV